MIHSKVFSIYGPPIEITPQAYLLNTIADTHSRSAQEDRPHPTPGKPYKLPHRAETVNPKDGGTLVTNFGDE